MHGDLKSSNVVLDRGRPVLIDFGLSAGVDRVSTRPLAGTFDYMAPELMDARPRDELTDSTPWLSPVRVS